MGKNELKTQGEMELEKDELKNQPGVEPPELGVEKSGMKNQSVVEVPDKKKSPLKVEGSWKGEKNTNNKKGYKYGGNIYKKC